MHGLEEEFLLVQNVPLLHHQIKGLSLTPGWLTTKHGMTRFLIRGFLIKRLPHEYHTLQMNEKLIGTTVCPDCSGTGVGEVRQYDGTGIS